MTSKKSYKTIDEFLSQGLDSLSTVQVKDKASKKSYYDKFKIKIKPKTIKTALKQTTVKNKYRKFYGNNTDPDSAFGPANAGEMSSIPGETGGTPAPGPVADAGFGIDAFGVTAFGEGINRAAGKLFGFINDLKKNGAEPAVLDALVEGYRNIFHTIESESTVILCGIQPSLQEFFKFDIDDFVFALNNYVGDVVSIYVGEHNGMEPIKALREWYADIGVDKEIIDNILFVEKTTPTNEHTEIDIPFGKGNDSTICSVDDLKILTSDINNPILVGCADMYFMPDMMVALSEQHKKFQVDRKFLYLI